jgi:N-acetylmuramoyl-L-alanine amidase
VFARLPPLARLTLVCAALVLVAWALFATRDDPATVELESAPTSEPSPFGEAPATGPGVVRTASGLVLPIVGGEAGAWQVLTPCANEAVVDGERITGAHVVLDPGHGGEETGAIGPSGVVEAELNLDVAQRTAELLRGLGATVVLTRDTDVRVTLRTRAEIVNALQPLAFVSIHHNGGPTTPADRPSVQVYHQHETPDSARLAGVLFEELQAAFAPFSDTWSGGNFTGVRARIDEDGDFYGILRGTAGTPAVLAEALYQSSEPEASLLLEPKVRQAEAEAIARAIVRWLESGYAGSGFLPPLVSEESAGGGGGTGGCEEPPELR